MLVLNSNSIPKFQFEKIVCFHLYRILDDFNRVILNFDGEPQQSDYINASYIDVSETSNVRFD